MIYPDPMGEAAAIAAQHATAMGFALHGAACGEMDRADRVAQLRRAFRHWAPMIRAMSALAMEAPVASSQAETEAGRLADFLERRNTHSPAGKEG